MRTSVLAGEHLSAGVKFPGPLPSIHLETTLQPTPPLCSGPILSHCSRKGYEFYSSWRRLRKARSEGLALNRYDNCIQGMATGADFSGFAHPIPVLEHAIMNPPQVASPPATRTERPVKRRRQSVHRGICSTCSQASRCAFSPKDGRVVLNCGEFTPVEPRQGSDTRSVRSTSAPRPRITPTEPRRREKVMGLCASCEGRETCTFPKPEGGVWRCEEYR